MSAALYRDQETGRFISPSTLPAAHWNELVPVGTPVRYFPIFGDWELFEDTVTRSSAWVLGDHTDVVQIDGRAGGVSLRHLLIRACAVRAQL